MKERNCDVKHAFITRIDVQHVFWVKKCDFIGGERYKNNLFVITLHHSV